MKSKVVVFVSASSELWGAENSLLGLGSAMVASGKAVRLLSCPGPLSAAWAACIGPADVQTVHRSRRRFLRGLAFCPHIARLDQGSRVVLFDPDLLPWILIYRMLVRRRDIAFVVDLHNVYTSRRGTRRIRRFSAYARRVISVSAYAARQVEDVVDTRIVYRSISVTGAFSEPPPFSTIGVVGRLDAEKRADVAIEAVAKVDGIDLVLRGGVMLDSEEALEELLHFGRRLLGSRLHYCGRVAHDQVFAGIQAVVVCSPTEPSGRIVAEAQAFGLPVIVPDAGGAPEFVVDGESGLVYVCLDSDSLAEKLRLLAASPRLVLHLSEGARRQARSNYSSEQQAMLYWAAATGG